MAKSSISTHEAARVASLAKLALEKDDLEKYARQLDEILGYVGKVNGLVQDTQKGANSKLATRELKNIWRADAVCPPPVSIEDLLADVPELEGTHIKVPAILGGDDE